MKKIITLILILILLVAFGCTSKTSVQNEQSNSNNAGGMDVANSNTDSSNQNEAVKKFTIHGSNFKFDPSEIRVKVGDRVKINYISDDIGHNLMIEGLNIGTAVVSNGGSQTLEFTAERAGNFRMFCSVGQHASLGMEGQLIVEA